MEWEAHKKLLVPSKNTVHRITDNNRRLIPGTHRQGANTAVHEGNVRQRSLYLTLGEVYQTQGKTTGARVRKLFIDPSLEGGGRTLIVSQGSRVTKNTSKFLPSVN